MVIYGVLGKSFVLYVEDFGLLDIGLLVYFCCI